MSSSWRSKVSKLSVSFVTLASVMVSREAFASVEPDEREDAYKAPPSEVVSKDRPNDGNGEEKEWEDPDHVRVGALLGLGFPRPMALELSLIHISEPTRPY